jgi:hypothetical protein
MKATRECVALICLLLALTACRRAPAGGQEASHREGSVGTSGSIGPVSSMVSKQDVARIAGMPIPDLRESGDVCEYLTANPDVAITIRVARGTDGQGAWEQAKAAALAYQMMPHAPVAPPPPPAAADEAMYGIRDSLAIRKGNVFIGVVPPPARVANAGEAPQRLSDEERLDIAKKLAEKVLAQLPK